MLFTGLLVECGGVILYFSLSNGKQQAHSFTSRHETGQSDTKRHEKQVGGAKSGAIKILSVARLTRRSSFIPERKPVLSVRTDRPLDPPVVLLVASFARCWGLWELLLVTNTLVSLRLIFRSVWAWLHVAFIT